MMDKNKEYNISKSDEEIDKVEESAIEYRNIYTENVRKDFERDWQRGITPEEFGMRLKEKLRLRDER